MEVSADVGVGGVGVGVDVGVSVGVGVGVRVGIDFIVPIFVSLATQQKLTLQPPPHSPLPQTLRCRNRRYL